MSQSHVIDPRVEFYLENREQIEEWRAIRKDAYRTCTGILEQLPGVLEDMGDIEGFDLTSKTEDGSYRFAGYTPSGSPVGKDGYPFVAVMLGWTDKVIFDDPNRYPDIGIRVQRGTAEWDAVYEHLRAETRELRHARKARRTHFWPMVEHCPAETGWWSDPDGYLEYLANTLAAAVEAYSDSVLGSLASARSTSG